MISSLADGLFSWLSDWAVTLNAIGSLILTSFLVLLYMKQTSLLAAQQRLMRYEQEPELEVEQWEVLSDDDGYFIEMVISNYGGGAASNLQCQIDLFNGYHIHAKEIGSAHAYRISDTGDESYGSSIRPHNLHVEFRSEPGRGHVDVFEDKMWDYSFKGLVEKFYESTDDPIYGKLTLRYRTSFGEYQKQSIHPAMKIEVNDDGWHISSVDTIPKEEKYEDKNVIEYLETPPEEE